MAKRKANHFVKDVLEEHCAKSGERPKDVRLRIKPLMKKSAFQQYLNDKPRETLPSTLVRFRKALNIPIDVFWTQVQEYYDPK